MPRLRRLLRSTTARLLLPLAGFQLVATGGVLAIAWVAGHEALSREERALAAELRYDLLTDYSEGGIAQLRETIDERLRLEGRHAPVLLLTDARGERLAGNLRTWPKGVSTTAGTIVAPVRLSNRTAPVETIVSVSPLAGGYRLLAGWGVEGNERLGRTYERALLAALLFGIPLAAVVAVVVARMVGTRLRMLAATAHRVGAGALEARVPLDGSGDGFDRLGEEINAMLERIEVLVGELRMVTDGLAHDLRSPLTRLRSALERSIAEAGDHAPALDRALAETDTLLTMLATALQISRAEAGIGRDTFVPTNLNALLVEVAEIYGPVVEESGVALTVVEAEGNDIVLPVSRELIAQALGNLVDNALKHASGDAIALQVLRRGDTVRLTVRDNGKGIARERHAQARQRFGRLDPARSIAGSGLGLTLVEAVARLHGGGMELEDAAPGLAVTLVITA